jgi:hypothetical protein
MRKIQGGQGISAFAGRTNNYMALNHTFASQVKWQYLFGLCWTLQQISRVQN